MRINIENQQINGLAPLKSPPGLADSDGCIPTFEIVMKANSKIQHTVNHIITNFTVAKIAKNCHEMTNEAEHASLYASFHESMEEILHIPIAIGISMTKIRVIRGEYIPTPLPLHWRGFALLTTYDYLLTTLNLIFITFAPLKT